MRLRCWGSGEGLEAIWRSGRLSVAVELARSWEMHHRARNAQEKGLKARGGDDKAQGNIHYLRERAERSVDLGWFRPRCCRTEGVLEATAHCRLDWSEFLGILRSSGKHQT